MASNCKDCDRLLLKPSGTAPERPAFQQPNMYDHFGNFQKFKQSKEEQLLKQHKEELLKFNTKFTDLNLNDVLSKKDFDQAYSQDKKEFRPPFRMGGCDGFLVGNSNFTENPLEVNSLEVKSDGVSVEKSLAKRKSLLTLTRTPVQCPITLCNRTIGITSVLSHYLRDHSEDFGVQCQEIYLGKRSVLIFDPTTLEFGDNVCLGILAYGGNSNESSSRPAERGLCIQNAFLPKSHEELDAHLPILIMACHTYWSTLLTEKEPEMSIINNPNYITQELLVIWLASVQTTKPIHCTITVYDKTMSSSRSSIIQIRNLNDAQNPKEFIINDTNYMCLSHGEIQILSQDLKECIHMELMINEY